MPLKKLSTFICFAISAATFVASGRLANAANWVGGAGGWNDLAGAMGWDTALPPDGTGAIAAKIDSAAATTTQNSGFARTLGTIGLGGVGDIAWTVDALDGITLDQNGLTDGAATISNTNTSTGPANALILSGPITLSDDLLVTNSGGSKNTTGAIQLNGVISGFGNVTFRNEVTSTSGLQEGFIRLGLNGANDFFGNVLIQKGITWISNNTSLGYSGNMVTLGDSSGGGQGSASLLLQTGGVNSFSNPITVVSSAGGDLFLGTTATTNPTIGSQIQLNASSNLNIVSASTHDDGLTMSGPITGAGSITMPASLPTNVANVRVRFNGFSDYTGGTTVSGGTLLFANSTDTDDPNTYTTGPVGRGTLTLNGGAMAIPASFAGIVTVANPISVTANSISTVVGSAGDGLTLSGPISIAPNAQMTLVSANTSTSQNLTGSISGGANATLRVDVTGTTSANGVNNFSGDWSGFSGTFSALTGSNVAASLGAHSNFVYHTVNGQNIKFEINNAGGTNIAAQQSRFVRFGLNDDPNGTPAAGSLFKMGSLSGNGMINAQTGGTSSYPSTNYEVGHLNLDTEFSGQIFRRATTTFTKVGTGRLTLSGPNSYDGTTVVSAGTLIAGARVESTTIVGTPATVLSGSDTITMSGHGLSVGDRLLSVVSGGTPLTTTTNYVVHTVVSANEFKVALAATPGTIVTATTAPTALSFFQQSAFGAGTSPIQLGDANTGSNNVTLLTGGPFTIERGVNVTSDGSGIATIGGDTDNNSVYAGAVSLAKNVNISQVATTGSNAVTFSGVITSSGAFGVTKVGSGKAALSANNTYTGTTTVSNGTLLVNGSHTVGGAYVVDAGGTLGGTGSIGSPVTNNGTIAPGTSVGTLTTTSGNNVTMGENSHLAIELSGATADKLVVGGLLNLSAADFLDVTGVGTGTSWIIASYASLMGTFNNITLGYTVDYGTGTNSNITLNLGVAGDFNNDGKVNAADYVVWRKTMPGNTAKYNEWRQNFGNPPGSGSGLDGTGAVPEPSVIILALVGSLGLLISRGRVRISE